MSKTINRVDLLGRVGTDPEMRYTPAGTAVTQFRMATDRPRRNGEAETDWHSVTCWAQLAEIVNEHVGKGDRLYLTGRLAQNSWDGDDGQRRHRTEIHAQEVVFLDSRNGERHNDGRRQHLRHREAGNRPALLAQHRQTAVLYRAQHGAASLKREAAPLSFHICTKAETKKMKTDQLQMTVPVDRSTGPEQAPVSSTGQALLDALRSNLNLLGELAMRYDVETKPERPKDPPNISRPGDVRDVAGTGDVVPRTGAAAGAPAGHQEQRRGSAGDLPGGRSTRPKSDRQRCCARRSSPRSLTSSSSTTTRRAIRNPVPRTSMPRRRSPGRPSCLGSSYLTTWSSAETGSSA